MVICSHKVGMNQDMNTMNNLNSNNSTTTLQISGYITYNPVWPDFKLISITSNSDCVDCSAEIWRGRFLNYMEDFGIQNVSVVTCANEVWKLFLNIELPFPAFLYSLANVKRVSRPTLLVESRKENNPTHKAS